MRLFRAIGSKLQGANEALATAQKAWQDERLSTRAVQLDERERALRVREERVAAQLSELHGRRWSTRMGYLLAAALAGIPAYFVGTHAPTSAVWPKPPLAAAPAAAKPAPVKVAPQAPAEKAVVAAVDPPAPKTRPRHPEPDWAARQGLYGTGGEFNVGWYCLDKEEAGEITFEDCLAAVALEMSNRR